MMLYHVYSVFRVSCPKISPIFADIDIDKIYNSRPMYRKHCELFSMMNGCYENLQQKLDL